MVNSRFVKPLDEDLVEELAQHHNLLVTLEENVVAGGAGKTPVALSLLEILKDRGLKPAALTRGYGGAAAGPLRVVPGEHDATTVGDEALLLAAAAPTWVARDRVAGAKAAAEDGAQVIVMDDGFQNPSLKKDLSLLVIDAGYGLGNGRVMPSGPLRETVASGLARADAVTTVTRADADALERAGGSRTGGGPEGGQAGGQEGQAAPAPAAAATMRSPQTPGR